MPDDIVEKIKSTVRIEQVVDQDGYPLVSHGRYRKCTQHDSLVVDVAESCYFWNSRGEHGDVISWVMNRKGVDFKSAVEDLCRRGGIPEPDWGRQDAQTRLATRAREDAFDVAAKVFAKWLSNNRDALAFIRGRGWTEETTASAKLGYTGTGTEAEKKELSGELSLNGVDLKSAAAVSILGLERGVAVWCNNNGVQPHENWIKNDRIPGLIGQGSIVYPHIRGGKVKYFSLRGISDKRHYNLPKELAGDRQPYFNSAYSHQEDYVVVVEGQADAITLAQWDIPAVALAGTSMGDDLSGQIKHHTMFLGMDQDDAGKISFLKKIGFNLSDEVLRAAGVEDPDKVKDRKAKGIFVSPMARVVVWPLENGGKDANDWLKVMYARQMAVENQREQAMLLLAQSKAVVEYACEIAGKVSGAAKDQATRDAFALIARMEDFDRANYRTKLTKSLGIGYREYEKILKTLTNSEEKTDAEMNIVEVIGGNYDGHLLELLYDPLTESTKLAVRWPDGRISEEERVAINGNHYVPIGPNALIRKEVILFPSHVPDSPKSVRELVTIIKLFVHRYLDVDNFYENLIAYYTLFSWMYDSFTVLPYLRALGDYGTGKTRLIWVAGICCYRPMLTAGATTTSPIFRMLDGYRGTLILDEADFGRSDEASDIIKILNTGYMKNVPVLRSKDTGNGNFDVEAFNVYGPKIIATRKKFADRALESRCLTKEMGGGVPRDDIPIVLPKDFYNHAREIRNHLLRWRMEGWVPERDVDYNSIDKSIESRLNQVTIALKAIIPPEETDMRKEIDAFIKEKNRELIVERSQTLAAKILEALVAIKADTPFSVDPQGVPFYDLSLKAIADKTNKIIDKENDDEEEESDESGASSSSNKRKVTPKKCGSLISNVLQLRTERLTGGPNKGRYFVMWDEDRVKALKRRYGLEE